MNAFSQGQYLTNSTNTVFDQYGGAPRPVLPSVSLAHDTGMFGDDGVTSDPTLTLGNIEPDAGTKVEYSINNGATWSLSAPVVANLVQGLNSVQVRQTNAAGGVSATASLSFVLDTRAPSTPTLVAPSVAGGYVNLARDTPDQSLTGTAEAGSAVKIYDGNAGTPLATVTADASTGAWRYTLGSLADGSAHSYTATATDTAGNVSGPSAALGFTVDSTSATVTITRLGPASTNALPVDYLVTFSESVTGVGSDQFSIALPPNTSLVNPTVTPVGGSGGTQYRVTVAVVPNSGFTVVNGTIGLRLNGTAIRDGAGNPLAASVAAPLYTIDQIPPDAPAAPTLAHDTGVAGDGITTDPTLVYPAPGTGNTLVYSLDGAAFSGTAPTIATDGSAVGSHTVAIKQQDAVGNLSAVSSVTFTLQNAGPVAWRVGAEGNWSDPANWAAGTVPLGTDDVLVKGDPDPSEVSYIDLDASEHLHALTLDASVAGSSALVSLREGTILTLDGGLTLTSNTSPSRGARVVLHEGAGLAAVGGISLDNRSILVTYGQASGTGAASTITAAIQNAGTILVSSGGSLKINGPVTGTGRIELVDGGTLELDGSTGQEIDLLGHDKVVLDRAASVTSQVIVYGDTVGTLDLKGSGTFGGALTFSHVGGTLDLVGAATASYALSGSQLHIVETDGSSLDLTVYLSPLGNAINPSTYALPSGYALSATGDGSGGTVLSFAKGVMQTWIGGAQGDWSNAGSWQSGKVPGPADDILSPAYGETINITTAVQAASLEDTAGIVRIAGGALTLTGDLGLVGGTLRIFNGGTLTANRVTIGGGVSIATSVDHIGHTAVINADIQNDGAIYAGESGGLVINGAVSGSGLVIAGGASTLEFTGAVSQDIGLRASSKLVLDDAGAVTGSISVDRNDALDLRSSTSFGGTLLFGGVLSSLDLVGVTSATLAGTTLRVTTAANQVLDLKTLFQQAAAGPDFSLYTRDDGAGGTIVSIRSTVQHAPIGQNAQTTVQAGSFTYSDPRLLLGGYDPDFDPVSIKSVQVGSDAPAAVSDLGTQVQGTYGILTVRTDGTAGYQQNQSLDAVSGRHAVDTFQYGVSDDRGGTGTGTVSVTINRAPTPVNDSASVRGASLSVDAAHGVLANDIDPDGDTLSVYGVNGFQSPGQSIPGLYGDLTLNADGSYIYTVTTAPTMAGAHEIFSYSVADNSYGSASLDPGSQPDLLTAVLDIGLPLLSLARPTLSLTGIGAGATPVVAGTAEVGSTVTLTDGSTGATLGTGTADAVTGAFAITGSGLAAGQHVLTATAVGTTGGASPASNALTIEVGTASGTAGQLDALQAEAGLSAIYLTDSHALPIASRSLIASLVARDPDALAAIQGGYVFAVTTATGVNTTRSVTYDATSQVVSTTNTTSVAGVVSGQVTIFADGSSDSRTFAAGVISGEVIRYAPGGPDISETKVFTAGVLTRDTVVHAGNTKDVFISGIRNQAYTDEHSAYDGAGILVSTIRTTADGTPTYGYALGQDGSKTTQYFDASGLTKSSVVRVDGSSDVTTYTAGLRSAEVITFAPGGPDISEAKAFTAGVLTLDTVIHADKAKDVYTSGVRNKDYANEHSAYNSAGVLTSTVRTTADGKPTYTYSLASGGTKTTNFYDANGLTKSSVARADGFSDSKTYSGQTITGEAITYAPGGPNLMETKVFTAGVLTRDTVVHADSAKDVYAFTATGAPSAHSLYNAAGTLLLKDVTNANLSHTIALFSTGQVVGSTPIYDDTFSNSSQGINTFALRTGFGHDTITSFHGSSSASHDLIAIAAGLGSDYAHLQSSIKSSGHDTLITFSATDSLLIKNVAPSALSSGSFNFSS